MIIDKNIKLKHLCFYNIPYDDYDSNDIRSSYNNGLVDGRREAFKNLWDIPQQSELGEKFPFTGYVDINGDVIKCKSCEHEKIVRDIIYNNKQFFQKYRNTPASFFEKKPQGMLQEEYFLMKYLGYVKVSSFEAAPTKRILFRYYNLTWKQTDTIFPT